MKKYFVLFLIVSGTFLLYSFTVGLAKKDYSVKELRKLYSGPASKWPKPNIDSNLSHFLDIAALPANPYLKTDSNLTKLGKLLFFEPRISGSNQISCASCHVPSLNWTDGRITAMGHDHQEGGRNTPTIMNTWYNKSLFWDGRSSSHEDQAFGPINSEIEMHGDFGTISRRLTAIPEYKELFNKAFGTDRINADRITKALAAFQRTVQSRKSRFDEFVSGKSEALTDSEVRGMHLFRTQARCVNCHNGPMFTDDQFHNIGLTYYKRKYEDLGRYNFTHDPQDVGKFKTPTLRDIMVTRPWMHNGLFEDLGGIINMYNSGMHMIDPTTPAQLADSMYPKTSPILQPLKLTEQQKKDLAAFIASLSTPPFRVPKPQLPGTSKP